MSLLNNINLKGGIYNNINLIKNVKSKGFLYIFGSNIINKIIQFLISIIFVRLLSKTDFGIFSYVQNIMGILLLFNGLGIAEGILQFCSSTENYNEKYSYMKIGFIVGLSANFIIVIITILVSKFINLPIIGSNKILFYFSFIPVIYFCQQIITTYLRTELKNKEFSMLINIYTISYFLLSIIGIKLFSILGIAIGKYIAFIITILTGYLFIKKDIHLMVKQNIIIKYKEIKAFISFSIISASTYAISQILYLIDIFLIGLIIKDTKILANYKIATLFPFALTFISHSVMIFVYPYFAKNFKNIYWIKANYYKLISKLFFINLIITTILLIFAPLIIQIVFGKNYSNALLPFRILTLGFLIESSFRIPSSKILFSIRRVKINFINGTISSILNIIIDIILIINYGSVGAAISTSSILIISALLNNIYLYRQFRNKSI